MNLWFRLIGLTAKQPWKQAKRVAGTDVIVTKMRVWLTDLDINRHVTNSRYFAMADIARTDFTFKTGAHKVAWKHKAMPIVGDTWGKFRKELKLFQKFEVHTKLIGWDEKWFFMQHQYKRNGRVVGMVVVRGLFRSGKGHVAPSAFFHALKMDDSPPAMEPWLEQWSKSCDHLSQNIRENENLD